MRITRMMWRAAFVALAGCATEPSASLAPSYHWTGSEPATATARVTEVDLYFATDGTMRRVDLVETDRARVRVTEHGTYVATAASVTVRYERTPSYFPRESVLTREGDALVQGAWRFQPIGR